MDDVRVSFRKVLQSLTRRYIEHKNGAVNRFRESTAKHEFSPLVGLANMIQMKTPILYALVEAIDNIIEENVMHQTIHTPAHSIPSNHPNEHHLPHIDEILS
jgi:hypothetical protein